MGRTRRDEDGTGVVGTTLGAVAFLALLLFSVHVLVGLSYRSVVAAATYDAARAVAGGPSATAMADAEDNARHQLGRYGDAVTFTWAPDESVVRLTAHAPRPALLPAALSDLVGLGDIERTVTVRREQVR